MAEMTITRPGLIEGARRLHQAELDQAAEGAERLRQKKLERAQQTGRHQLLHLLRDVADPDELSAAIRLFERDGKPVVVLYDGDVQHWFAADVEGGLRLMRPCSTCSREVASSLIYDRGRLLDEIDRERPADCRICRPTTEQSAEAIPAPPSPGEALLTAIDAYIDSRITEASN